jgi:hypothetical protein
MFEVGQKQWSKEVKLLVKKSEVVRFKLRSDEDGALAFNADSLA